MADAIAQALQPRDEQGRFRAKADEPAQQPAAAQEPVKPPEAKQPDPAKPPEQKPADEPPGLSADASTRFREMANRVKETETKLAEYEPVVQMVQDLNQRVEASGLNQQEFWQAVEFGTAMKRGDWRSVEPILAAQFANFRMAMGRDPQGADPLAHHPDILQAVQAGQMTHQFAIELARGRSMSAQQQQRMQVEQQTQQRQQQYEQTVNQAAGQIGTMVKQWEMTDLDWPRKREVMDEKAREIAAHLPPEQWAFAIKTAYDTLGRAMPIFKPAPTPNALRASGAQGGAKEPQSMLEAITGALNGSTE